MIVHVCGSVLSKLVVGSSLVESLDGVVENWMVVARGEKFVGEVIEGGGWRLVSDDN